MRKLLLLICLLPILAFAQDFKLSVGGGYIPPSSGIPNTFKPTVGNKEINPGFIGMIRAGFTSGRFEFGGGFEYGCYKRKGKLMYSNYNYEYFKDMFEVWHAASFCVPYGYCNVNFRLAKKVKGYGGAMIGGLLPFFTTYNNRLMLIPKEELPYPPQRLPELNVLDHPVLLGIQTGINVDVGKKIVFYAEFGVRTYQTFAEQGQLLVNYRLWYFPVTAGFSFNLFHLNFSKKPVKW